MAKVTSKKKNISSHDPSSKNLKSLQHKSMKQGHHHGSSNNSTSSKHSNKESRESIVIDEAKGMVFATEDELYEFFSPHILTLEKDFFLNRPKDDIPDSEFPQYEEFLELLLDNPAEVWELTLSSSRDQHKVFSFIGHFNIQPLSPEEQDAVPNEEQEEQQRASSSSQQPKTRSKATPTEMSLPASATNTDTDSYLPFYYVALVYMTDNVPTFIYLHFPTRSQRLVDHYRQGEMIYDRIVKEVEHGAVEGDALSEGDDLAVGLYKAMLKLRSDKDIPEEEFKSYEDLREESIEEPDEIWRTHDLEGNVLVTFIRDFSEEEPDLHYIAVTIEDSTSNSHALLFSFPTTDLSLVERYRHGENLQADEVIQEASH